MPGRDAGERGSAKVAEFAGNDSVKKTNNETFKCEVLYRNSHPYQKSDRCGYQKKKDRGVSLKEKRSF